MYYAIAHDTFMSGWGEAKGKINLYVVKCKTYEQLCLALTNMLSRTDFKNVRSSEIEPNSNASTLVTFAEDGHAFFRRRVS
jgi:hypothetical protein